MKKKSSEQPAGSLISFMSNMVKDKGGINLAQGIPGFSPPAELIEILRDITGEELHQYAPGNGDSKLVAQLLNHYATEAELSAENLLVLNGATEAISLVYLYLLKTCGSDFSVLAFDPAYESYRNLPLIYGQKFITQAATAEGRYDFTDLEKKISENNVKLLFLNSPGNPYGSIWSEQEYAKIAALAITYDFYIIFDGVYQELYFQKAPYLPLQKLDDRLFYINSFSKMLSITGWRVGYLICNAEHMKKIRLIHDYTGLCAPTLQQRAIALYLEASDFGTQYVAKLRAQMGKSYGWVKGELEQLGFHIPATEGGYFIWAELPQGIDDGFQFAIDLYDSQQVAVVPGIHFSPTSPNYVRINIARKEGEIEEALLRIKRYFEDDAAPNRHL